MQTGSHRKRFSPCRKRTVPALWPGGDGSGPAVVRWAAGVFRLPVWQRGLRGAGCLPHSSRSLLLRWRKVQSMENDELPPEDGMDWCGVVLVSKCCSFLLRL